MGINDTDAAWLEHLKAWLRSGMTQNEYCLTYGIHPKTFSNRKTKLRKHLPDLPNLTRSTIVPPAPAAPFVTVTIEDGNNPPAVTNAGNSHHQSLPHEKSGVHLQIGHRFQISLSAGFDTETLERLLAVLPV
jgi:hypothetical protein